jgi:hypothetical protein
MRLILPSERKFEVYHAVETDQLSRREAARRFGLSPTRVQQIVADVKHFIARHGGEDVLNIEPQMLELASLRLCHERLSHLYRTTMRLSQGLDSRDTSAYVRLLQTAARLTIDQAKVAGRIGKAQIALIEAGELNNEVHEIVYEDSDDALSPPAGGCTENAAFESEPTPEELAVLTEVAASLGPDATSEQVIAEVMKRGLMHVFEKTPAQSAPAAAMPPGVPQTFRSLNRSAPR